MGKFDQLVLDKTEQGEMSFLENQSSKDELLRIHDLLANMEIEKQEDKKTVLMNKINTTIGFLNQLSLRLTHSYLIDITSQIEQKKQSIIEKVEESKSLSDGPALLEALEKIEAMSSTYYHQIKEEASSTVDQGIAYLEQREALLKEVEPMVLKIDALSDSTQLGQEEETLRKLAELYSGALRKDVKTLKGLQEEIALLGEFQKIGLPFLNTAQSLPQVQKAPRDEKTYPLFAKINDQIIDYQSMIQDGKLYVKYILEDGNYYFAVVESKETIDASYHQFEQNSLLSHEQSKDAWCKNLEVILSCLQMYYQINEFMRYQEISNKGEMTQEKDLEIKKYKDLLSFMENGILKQYLDYADLLSKKTLIGENVASNFYANRDAAALSNSQKARERIVVSILGNPSAKKEVTCQDMLGSLYDINEAAILSLMEAHHKEESAITLEPLAVSEQGKETLPTVSNDAPTQETNYDKIANYLEKRKQEINAPLSSNELQPKSIRCEESIYKDVNIYLDLEEARQITNQMYQDRNKGQGDYALLAYLKEGKLEGFTSKYQARQLAAKVRREDYFYLMMVQAVKDYVTFNEQKKRNDQFGVGLENVFGQISQLVLDDSFTLEMFADTVLDTDASLPLLIRNFDGRYLVEEKGDNPLFDQVLEDYQQGNPMFATKVIGTLTSLKEQLKRNDYQLPKKSSIVEVAIPSGKVA